MEATLMLPAFDSRTRVGLDVWLVVWRAQVDGSVEYRTRIYCSKYDVNRVMGSNTISSENCNNCKTKRKISDPPSLLPFSYLLYYTFHCTCIVL
ncbi:unnamed protein product [Phytomonas sp. EM1]|nr:unnamed protein product [Phytomonas sp. EM1]|eukprot:CCW64527.1 unnamed protein product [Phytomonas sp. isolate EM1]